MDKTLPIENTAIADQNKTHEHGGSPIKDFIRLGVAPRPLTDFSVNLNPLGPPREITSEWDRFKDAVTAYPSIDGAGVRQFYEGRFDLPQNAVLPGNGSIELIYLVPRALALKKVLIFSPSFHDYERAARFGGAEVQSLPLCADNEFDFMAMDRLESSLKTADALCIGNPNNPTGTQIDRDTLLVLAKKYPDKLFLVDEAFIQFISDYKRFSLLDKAVLCPNIIVFHSLTKFYALAGLRLGAAISHPKTISRLAAKKEPWTINGIADTVVRYLSGCREYEKQTLEMTTSERHRMTHQLQQMVCVRVFRPSANFFLAQWKGTDNLDDLLAYLLSHGIYVRDCRNFPGLEDQFFRFGIQIPQENDRFMSLLAGYPGNANG